MPHQVAGFVERQPPTAIPGRGPSCRIQLTSGEVQRRRQLALAHAWRPGLHAIAKSLGRCRGLDGDAWRTHRKKLGKEVQGLSDGDLIVWGVFGAIHNAED